VGEEDTAHQVRNAYQRRLVPGQALFQEGEPGDLLYVIQAGDVELVRDAPGGQRVVARLGPGDFFGELSIVEGTRRTSRAVAVNHACVLELDRETLETMCVEQPEIAIRMLRGLAIRLFEAEQRLAALGVDDLLRPLVRALVRRAEPAPEGAASIPTAEAGLTLLDAHRALQHLFERGLLQLVYEGLFAPDLEGLSACLDHHGGDS
jgi:CRP-like cAMP-binding protein